MSRVLTRVLAAAVLLTGVPVTAAVTATSAAAQNDCAAASNTMRHEVPWAQERLTPQRAWPLTQGAGVTIAVVGTGVSPQPPQLAGAVLPGVDLRPADTFGRDGEVRTGRGDADCAGHGTFAASLMVARPRQGVGLVGVAPAATVLPVRVTTDPARTEPAALAAGIKAAVESGAKIVAVTLATNALPLVMREAIELAKQRDVVVVAPAALPSSMTSEIAENQKPLAFPAALAGVVAVAAIDQDGENESRGRASQPVLAAPGDELVGLPPSGPGQVIGSSADLAVAFVAGAAALVRARHPQLSADAVVRRLTGTADHPAGPMPDPAIGYGVVDPTAAVTALGSVVDNRVAGPDAAALELPREPVPDPRPARTALIVAGGVVGLALLATLVALAISAARRRATAQRHRPPVRSAPRRGPARVR